MSARGLGRTLSVLLAVVLLVEGFPVGDRVTAAAVLAALASFVLGAAAPGRGLPAAVFACAVTGAATSARGPHGILPWPALIALWFGAGAAIRDAVRERPSPRTSLDSAADALGVFWFASAVVACVSARSIWAIAHGLALRAVNVIGTPDAQVIHGTVVAIASVFAGLTIFRTARRASPEIRRRACLAFVAGAAVSAADALLQSRGWVTGSQSRFWTLLGRFQGLASDPNAAGVVFALALAPAFVAAVRGTRKAFWAFATALLAAGVAVSGSRSGILMAALSVAAVAVVEAPGMPRWARPALGLFAVGITVVLFAASGGPGGAAERLVSILDPRAPLAYRTSSRGLFWSAAMRGFRAAPLGGLGWNAFSWHLPTLAAARGTTLAVMDNPGNFYLQILAETGIAGALLFLVFVVAASRSIGSALRRENPERGSACALVALAPALAIGSHLLAAEVAIAAFLFLAAVGRDVSESRPDPAIRRKVRARNVAAALVGAAGWVFLLAPSARASEAFRYFPEIGFYLTEGGVDGFRWMRPHAAIRVAAGATQRLALSYPGPPPLDRLRIRSAGRLLYSAEIGKPRRTLALVSPSGRPAIFRFDGTAALRPSSAGGSDSRLLSLQVFSVRP